VGEGEKVSSERILVLFVAAKISSLAKNVVVENLSLLVYASFLIPVYNATGFMP